MSHRETTTLEEKGRATMRATQSAEVFNDPSWPVEVQDEWVSIPGSPWVSARDQSRRLRRVNIVQCFWLAKEELPAGDYLFPYPTLLIRGILKGYNDYNAYSSLKAIAELEQRLIPPTSVHPGGPFPNLTNKLVLMDLDAGEVKTHYHTLPWLNGRAAESFDFPPYIWGYQPDIRIDRSVDLAIALRVDFWAEVIGWGDIQASSYRFSFRDFTGPEVPFGFRLPEFPVVGYS